MKTYDIIISHHEKIEADNEEDARNRFYDKLKQKGLLPSSLLDSLLKISHQLTFQELIENRMKFGADERKTALGRQFSLRTIESVNRDVQVVRERNQRAERVAETLQMVQDSLDDWIENKRKENWLKDKNATESKQIELWARKRATLPPDEFDEEMNKSASEEALSN